ncbi:tetratricopeptide repeat protein [Croceibacterium ferulae]|uniref:tetratricopeptide repeat protein n=1 Tax=Croceibacterium ferulae TaxID=1854641 RepID=UPI001F4DF42D|nr:tetratricopeptide repeat protein [Croceibacterium ferulae]
MSLIPFFAAAVLVGQPITSVPGPDLRITELRDVAYEELATGQTEAALDVIHAELASRPGDPALLINLGSAYLRLGRMAEAQTAFEAAAVSNTRYDLELADGRWVDSRRAARLAQAGLADRPLLARR